MAALTSLLRRSRHPDLLRAFCTTTTITPAAAKTRLRREFDPDRAVSLLESIPTDSLSAGSTRHALTLTARRLSRSRRFTDAATLLSSHLPASPTEPHLAAVLSSFAAANLPDHALSAFRSAAASLPSPISPLPFNALLSTFLQCRRHRRHRRVPDLFAELSKEFSITPNATSYAILIKSHCMSKDDAKAQQVLEQMREQGITPTTTIYTTLIDSMYKQKKTDEAELLWKETMESGCKPDQAIYNVKAMYFGLHGKPEEVLDVMAAMEAAGVKPDIITYNFLMTSYCKNGRMEDAKGLYSGLGEKGCSANAATYKHLLAELCAHGDFDAALGVFKDSLRRNKVPDFRTMKGLVVGLMKEDRVVEAKKVVAKVTKKFPENLLSGWRKLEKELGLSSDGEGVAEYASEEPLAKAESASAGAFELEEPAAEDSLMSEESAGDEALAPEASAGEEVPRGSA